MTEEVPASTDPVEALSGMVARLRSERDGLRRAMRNRAVIEQAKGVLVERMAIDPQAAFDQLVQLSTHSNVKLVELAAALVATRAPAPAALDDGCLPGLEALDQLAAPDVPRPAPVPVSADLEALRAQHQLLSARVATASSYDELAETLKDSSAGWPPPATVIVMESEADGALLLVGASGLSAESRSQWERVPPIQDLPMVAATQTRSPVLVTDASEDWWVSRAVLALPLLHDDRVVGVISLGWDAPLEVDDEICAYLYALADPCARRFAELAAPGPGSPHEGVAEGRSDASVLPLLVESLRRPAVVLVPEYEDDRIVDFHAECGSPAAWELVAAEGLDASDGSVLTVLPQLGSQVLLPALAEVVRTGESLELADVWVTPEREGVRGSYLVDLHAARLWDRVLVTWRAHSESDLLHEQLLFSEEVVDAGSFWWNLRTGETRWSPGLYRLAGRRPADGPLALDDVDRFVDPDDLAGVPKAVDDTLRGGRTLRTEVRGAGPLAGRRLRLTAEPKTDPDGTLWGVLGTVQDITDTRPTGTRDPQSGMAAAARRHRLLDELLAPPPVRHDGAGLSVAGRPGGLGTWYDVVPAPDGGTVLLVGEVAGDGAVAAAQRLRHAAAAYAVAGLAPGGLLAGLNAYLRQREPGRMATMVAARVAAGGRSVRWAVAGQVIPLLYPAADAPRVLAGPLGLPLGVAEGVGYDESEGVLDPGDRLLLYPEGLVAGGLAGGLATLLSAREPDLEALAGGRDLSLLLARAAD
ncbi:SpoIIE family protein phosphatase [Longispora sp. NPDC051575]|uniref:SpoIIE family protein phosphatase n=1 Tax=Longispora sp. NPDC051575 TaxID=3154943 RepID=UPI00343CED19